MSQNQVQQTSTAAGPAAGSTAGTTGSGGQLTVQKGIVKQV